MVLFALFLPSFTIGRTFADYSRGGSSALHSILIKAKRDPAIAALGKAVIEDNDCELDLSGLDSELIRYTGDLRLLSHKDLENALAEGVKNDFETGEIVSVQGWRFSKLETIIAVMSNRL